MNFISTSFLYDNHKKLFEIYLSESRTKKLGALFIDASLSDDAKDEQIFAKYFELDMVNPILKKQLTDKIKGLSSSDYINTITCPKLDQQFLDIISKGIDIDNKSVNSHMVLFDGKEQFIMSITIEKYDTNYHMVFRFNIKSSDMDEYGWKVSNKLFSKLCKMSLTSDEIYNNLRNTRSFTDIIQEGTEEYGQKLINKLELTNDILKPLNDFDTKMSPNIYEYSTNGDIINVSVGLLRYLDSYYTIKQLLYLKCNLEFEDLKNIVEIGSGYGGLCKVTTAYNPNCDYTLLDTPNMIKLSKRFLSNTPNIFYGDYHDINKKYDLCISEFTLCELNDINVKEYFKLLKYCSMCFLKMNIWDISEKKIFKDKLALIYSNIIEQKITPEGNYPDYILFCWGNDFGKF